MTSFFTCPLCDKPLTREERRWVCPGGHSFDRAKEGYCNLLPVNRKHSKDPGDDKAMAAARSAFLEKGYYAPLREELCRLAAAYTGGRPAVLDAGCGEGYYTGGLYHALLKAGKTPRMAGTDISKYILRRAAKRERDIEFAVASSYHLPVASESVDLILNCFSPMAAEEFFRVLRPGGALLYVVPSAMHLWEMKQVLYDRPYPNEEKQVPYPGFACREVRRVEGRIHLPCREDISALFQMTPYVWNTPQDGIRRLEEREELDCRIGFHIHVFSRLP